jgi:hypothetical protein
VTSNGGIYRITCERATIVRDEMLGIHLRFRNDGGPGNVLDAYVGLALILVSVKLCCRLNDRYLFRVASRFNLGVSPWLRSQLTC